MWDLTIPGNNDHDFYIEPGNGAVVDGLILVHNVDPVWACPVSASGGPGEGITLAEAKATALRDAGVPEGSKPLETRTTPYTTPEYAGAKQVFSSVDKVPIMFPEEVYETSDGELVTFQDHWSGHEQPDGIGSQEPHVHVRPIDDERTGVVPGAQEHYYYDPEAG